MRLKRKWTICSGLQGRDDGPLDRSPHGGRGAESGASRRGQMSCGKRGGHAGVMRDWQTIFSLFAAFLGWAAGANIVRVTYASGSRGMLTLLVGLFAFVAAHSMPFLLLSLPASLLALVPFDIVSGAVTGLAIGAFTGSRGWPENFYAIARFGPAVFFSTSLMLSGLIYWNELK